MIDPIPEEVSRIIELFSSSLKGVSFPEISADSLKAASREVAKRADELAKAEAAVSAARDRLDLERAQLMRTAERAAAYARIYSQAHPELEKLAGDLASIAPKERRGDSRNKKPRRRAPKPELPFVKDEPQSEAIQDPG